MTLSLMSCFKAQVSLQFRCLQMINVSHSGEAPYCLPQIPTFRSSVTGVLFSAPGVSFGQLIISSSWLRLLWQQMWSDREGMIAAEVAEYRRDCVQRLVHIDSMWWRGRGLAHLRRQMSRKEEACRKLLFGAICLNKL